MEIALNENPGLRKAYARLGEADAVAQVEKTTLPSLQQRVSAFEGTRGREAEPMTILMEDPRASGAPGIEPRWSHSAKDVVGTAYSTASPIWFTASGGVLSEIYYPTIDRPQIRDLQYLVTDGETFFHDVHRDQDTSIEYLGERGLGVRIINADRAGRYRGVMEVITDPHQPCVLLDTRLEANADLLSRLRLFVLL